MTNEPISIKRTSIEGLLVIERPVYQDNRGFFHEVFRQNELKTFLGFDFRPVQWSHSRSLPRVIRAIHTEGWNKLVYPVNGQMFAAIVDVRLDSATFGKVETFLFSNEEESSTHQALFISKGLGNSICVTGDQPVDYLYLVDEYWDDAKASGLAWDDPDLNIRWPVKNPILSERDRNNPTVRQLFPERFQK